MAIIGKALSGAAIAAWLVSASSGDSSSTKRLGTAIRNFSTRATAGRLSEPFGFYAPHVVTRGESRRVATAETFALSIAAHEVIAGSSSHPELRSASGVARLILGDSNEAVADLEIAAKTNGSANAFNDLSVAHLASAEEPGAFDQNVDALAAADHALTLDPHHAAARYNRALALERLGILTEARAAWRLATEADPQSPWASEAVTAERQLRSASPITPWRPEALAVALSRNDETALRSLLKDYPREVRRWGESVYLANWAEATRRRDTTEQLRMLERASTIARALADEYGETFLADVTEAIRRAPKKTKPVIAAAYLRYRVGRIADSRHNPSVAETAFREAQEAFARVDYPMALVAEYYLGSALHEEGRFSDALVVLDDVAVKLAAHPGYRALDAQTGWKRGFCLSATGSLSKAIAVFERSRSTFASLGDDEDAAAIEQFLAEMLEEVGEADQAWLTRRETFKEYSRHNLLERQVVALTSAAELSIRDRRWTRAASILNIAIEGAMQLHSPELTAQALMQRALVNASAGRGAECSHDLSVALEPLALIGDAAHRERLYVDQLFVEGIEKSEASPAAAAWRFDKVAELLEKQGAIRPLAWTYLERARAARRLRQNDVAQLFLGRCLDVLESRRRSLHDIGHRALILASSKEAFDEAISLASEQGDQTSAFDLAERSRGRALLDLFEHRETAAEEEARPMTAAAIAGALAPNAAIVTYESLPDRLLIHVVSARGLSAVSRAVSRESLSALADTCAKMVKRGGDVKNEASCIAAHEALIRPILPLLVDIEHVAFVPDGAFASLPIASLEAVIPFGRQLVSISEGPSATLVVSCAQRAAARRGEQAPALVVGAIVFDRNVAPEASSLRFVAEEAEAVAAIHRHANRLIGANATAERMIEEMPKASVIHFAGHAVRRSRRLQQSQLLLAPSANGSSVLDALTVSQRPLPHARVVYLSACNTGRASGRRDGVDNLALGFLVAGSPVVIAANWEIEDSQAAPVAETFHRLLAGGEDPVVAARRAFRNVVTPTGMLVIGGSAHLVR